MADFILECMYCGTIREETFWGYPGHQDIECKVCKDRHIKIKEKSSERIDYYAEKISDNKKNKS